MTGRVLYVMTCQVLLKYGLPWIVAVSLGCGMISSFAADEDQGVAQEVKSLMVTTPIDLTGETPLTVLPALLQSTRLLITNDSGPMHIAAALGTAVVAVFGPTNPDRTGPYGKGHAVLASRIPCSPCNRRSCENVRQLECLFTIDPQQVVEAAESLSSSRLLQKPVLILREASGQGR